MASHQALEKLKTLVVAGTAQTGHQVVHPSPQDAGLGSFSEALHPDPRLIGEGGPQQQQVHHGVQIALFEARANGFVLALGPGVPLGLVGVSQLGGQPAALRVGLVRVSVCIQDRLHARIGGKGPTGREQAHGGGEDHRNRSNPHDSSQFPKSKSPPSNEDGGLWFDPA